MAFENSQNAQNAPNCKPNQNDENPLADLEPIDLSIFLEKKKGYLEECKKVVRHLHEYGIVIVRDPRVGASQNVDFMEMMENYFSKPDDVKMEDARPELLFQMGSTPDYKEKAVPRCKEIAEFDKDNKPITICPPEFDPKWRFFWPIGPQPSQTEFKRLHANPVIPRDFPSWGRIMDGWGNKMLQTALTIAKMAAVGFGLPEDTFSKLMHCGPHLLAPTGSNLEKHGTKNTIFAHLHKDICFLAVHGKSNYPGLFVWLRNKKKALVRVPDNCFLAQAGMQFEYLTGGGVLAGFHEVVVSEETLDVLEKKRERGEALWRVSTTFFSHVASDNFLEPLEGFQKNESVYPRMKAGNQVLKELGKTIVSDN